MARYPKSKRKVDERGMEKTDEDRRIARQFGKEFFDGDRSVGYGGFNYHPRFWKDVVQDFISHYDLKAGSKVFDIGCAKGFMLYDFYKTNPDIILRGIDISEYAIENAVEEVKPYVSVGNANSLSEYSKDEFDLVISINTIHNLPLEECKFALSEIERIGKNAFITNDAWRNNEEKERMHNWNLTALTYMHVDDWKELFSEVGYKGDYYWFIP